MFLNLKALLSLNASGFSLGMKRAESQAKAFSKEIKGEFTRAFGTAALVAFTAKIIQSADRIVDLSQQLGISTKTLQEWGYAAKKSGASLEAVEQFFENIATAREKALKGDDEAITNFERLGVTLKNLKQGNLQSISEAVWGRVNTADVQKILAPLRNLGGKGASKLIPMFKENMEEVKQAANDAGQVFNDEMLLKLKEAKTEAEKLADVFKGPVASAITFAASKLREMFDSLEIVTAAISAFMGSLSTVKPKKFLGSVGSTAAAGVSKAIGGPAVNKSGYLQQALADATKAAESAMSEVEKKISARNAAFAARLKIQQALGSASGSDVVPDKVALTKITAPENLTNWQKAGAAVRQGPMVETVLKTIAENTERTASRLEELTTLGGTSQNVMEGGYSD